MGAIQISGHQIDLGADITVHRLPCARYGRRKRRPYMTVTHTWEGIPHRMIDGPPRLAKMRQIADIWVREKRSGTALLVTGAHVGLTRDPGKRWGWHAHSRAVNETSIGVEIDQVYRSKAELAAGKLGEITWDSLHTAARATLAIHRVLGIQWVTQWPHRGPVERIRNQSPITIGNVGHRDVVPNGDPINEWHELIVDEYGAIAVDFATNQDREYWRAVQVDVRARKLYPGALDGLPGRATTRALWRAGWAWGLYDPCGPTMAEAPEEGQAEPWVW